MLGQEGKGSQRMFAFWEGIPHLPTLAPTFPPPYTGHPGDGSAAREGGRDVGPWRSINMLLMANLSESAERAQVIQ